MSDLPGPDLAVLARRLSDAEAALERIESGTYAQCSACGRPIEDVVRSADPLADRCAACGTEVRGPGSPEGVGPGSPEDVGPGSPEDVGPGSPEDVGPGSPEGVGGG